MCDTVGQHITTVTYKEGMVTVKYTDHTQHDIPSTSDSGPALSPAHALHQTRRVRPFEVLMFPRVSLQLYVWLQEPPV